MNVTYKVALDRHIECQTYNSQLGIERRQKLRENVEKKEEKKEEEGVHLEHIRSY